MTRPAELKELAWLLAFRSEERVPHAARTEGPLTAPNATLFLECVSCLPTAPALRKVRNENFGTFSFNGSSGKPLLACCFICGAWT